MGASKTSEQATFPALREVTVVGADDASPVAGRFGGQWVPDARHPTDSFFHECQSPFHFGFLRCNVSCLSDVRFRGFRIIFRECQLGTKQPGTSISGIRLEQLIADLSRGRRIDMHQQAREAE